MIRKLVINIIKALIRHQMFTKKMEKSARFTKFYINLRKNS